MIFPAIPKRIQSALKALCSLAEAGQPLRANQVAMQIGVPPAETAKVLQLLSWGGFVNSRRGTKGGFWLSESPQRILAGQVISFLDTHHDSETANDDKCGQALRALSAQCQRKLQCLTVADLASGRVACASKVSARKAGSKVKKSLLLLRPSPAVAIALFGFLALLCAPTASGGTKPPKPAAVTLSYQVVEQNPETSSATVPAPGTQSTLENPFAKRRSREEVPIPTVLVLAKLTDSSGAPLPFKPVSFSVRTYFGSLSLGNRATGADGVAKMKITDRRLGPYTLQASFSGDESAAGASNSLEVVAAPRPVPSLPEQGMLITPYPTFWITLPFALFFGAMWAVFVYVGLVVWRAKKLGSLTRTTG